MKNVVGFHESSIFAVTRHHGIDVRETPAIVCLVDKQRSVGTERDATPAMNPKNYMTKLKHIVGRKFSDPDIQRDIRSLPLPITEGPDGFPLIHDRHLGDQSFTPTQVLGKVLSLFKGFAEKNLNAAVGDCCIAIPVYFTDLQRRAVLDAAAIAGLHPLSLCHETTATALAYGFHKTDLPDNGQLNVAFVDIGYTGMQVCIAGFKKGQLKVLAHAFDGSIGGRDFDEVLFRHFAAKFKDEYEIDVYPNPRACIRLMTACEKLKKVLNANPEAPLNIECLMDGKDVRGFIERGEFESISVPILERVKGPLEKALADAGLSVESIHSVEVVGPGTRIPAILKILTDFFGKEPRRTMKSECVSRGCALQCAILSPTFREWKFQVHESFPFSIAISWKGSAPDSQTGSDNQKSLIIFPKGSPVPGVKALTFYRSSTFSIDVMYADVSDLQISPKISTYTIGPFQSTKGERTKVKVKVRLNVHGIVYVESATMLEEGKIKVPVSTVKDSSKEAAKMDTDEATDKSSADIGGDVNMQDARGAIDGSSAGVENGLLESEDKPVQMETNNKVESSKKKVERTNVPVVEVVNGGLAPVDLQKAVEEEYEMAPQDREMEETKDKKNAVEAYVYDMRNKLRDKYQDFLTKTEKLDLTAKLQGIEDWLYEEGEDETKEVYVAKLDELKMQGDAIEVRHKEWTERGLASNQLAYCINSFREATLSQDPKFDHIDIAEKQKVVNECSDAEAWLKDRQQQQDALPKHATPVLLSADIRRKAEALDRFCRPVMTKPRPLQQQGVEQPPYQDDAMEETKDKKNALEAYVYDMWNKLHDKYQDFVTETEKLDLTAKLQEVEGWLYEEGEDETKGVYVAKLDELKKQGDPIEVRHKEWTERGPASDQLAYCIISFREVALSQDPKFDHIDIAEKQKVVNECNDAEAWLRERQQQQVALPKHATPVLLSADIRRKAEALDRFCRPVMTKPRPPPAKAQVPPPAQQQQGADQQPYRDMRPANKWLMKASGQPTAADDRANGD